jgi:hypothetical protein
MSNSSGDPLGCVVAAMVDTVVGAALLDDAADAVVGSDSAESPPHAASARVSVSTATSANFRRMRTPVGLEGRRHATGRVARTRTRTCIMNLE